MCAVPAHFFAFSVRATDPQSVSCLLVARLLSATIVAATLVLAARTATTEVKEDGKKTTKDGDDNSGDNHEHVVLDDAAVLVVLRVGTGKTHYPRHVAVGQLREEVKVLVLGDPEIQKLQ